MSKNDKPPFYDSVMHNMDLYDTDFKAAMESTQNYYDKFKDRNERHLEHQNNQSNSAQIQLISHFSLLATLTLTVVGLLITQSNQALTVNQKYAVIAVMTFEIISLIFGAIDYLQTISFHRQWALVYQHIDEEVEEKVNSSELQRVSELPEIESRHIKEQDKETKQWISRAMIISCVAGLLSLLILFVAYFFNIPGFK